VEEGVFPCCCDLCDVIVRSSTGGEVRCYVVMHEVAKRVCGIRKCRI